MVYFLYSDEQIKEKNKILKSFNKKFIPGSVVVGGRKVNFSQKSSSPKMARYIDTKIIASGEDDSQFTYTNPQTVSLRG